MSGAVVSAVGIATVTKIEKPQELALGLLPLALGAHLLVEGFVWLGLDGDASRSIQSVAVHAYLAFAWVLLPLYLPLCVLLVEPDRARRRAMLPFVGMGALTGAYLLSSMLTNGVHAHAAGNAIRYGDAGDLAVPATVLYIIATCAPTLISSHGAIVIFGVLNLLAVAVLVWADADGLTSLWCLWAAVVSVVVYRQLASWRRDGEGTDARTPLHTGST